MKSREDEVHQKLIITPTLWGPVHSVMFLTVSAGAITGVMAPYARNSLSSPQDYFLDSTFVSGVVVLVVGYAITSTLRSYFRDLDTMRQQLMSISFDTALCQCCTSNHVAPSGARRMCDRKILGECVSMWFGSLASFEGTLRSEVLELLARDLEQVLTTRSTIAVFSPLMWAFMDYAASFSRTEGRFWNHHSTIALADGLVVWIVAVPALKNWVLLVCKLARARPRNWFLEGMKNSLVVLIVLISPVTLGLRLLAYDLHMLSSLGQAGVVIAATLLHAIFFCCLSVALKAFLGTRV